MSDITLTVVLGMLYRLIVVLSGLAIVWLGYRLFRIGVYEKAGELKAAWGDKNLLLKQVAPGVFFALFGSAILVAGLVRGITFHQESGGIDDERVAAAIDKAADGQTLSDEERQILREWKGKKEEKEVKLLMQWRLFGSVSFLNRNVGVADVCR